LVAALRFLNFLIPLRVSIQNAKTAVTTRGPCIRKEERKMKKRGEKSYITIMYLYHNRKFLRKKARYF